MRKSGVTEGKPSEGQRSGGNTTDAFISAKKEVSSTPFKFYSASFGPKTVLMENSWGMSGKKKIEEPGRKRGGEGETVEKNVRKDLGNTHVVIPLSPSFVSTLVSTPCNFPCVGWVSER